MPRFLSPFIMLCLVGFSARLGYQMARPPVLPRFAAELGADAWLIGLIVGASTITGVFIKFPAGTLSDILGRRRMLLLGAAFFAFPPFLYLLVQEAYTLLALRFLHGFATAIFSPVAAAAVADLFQERRGEKLGWFGSANEFGSAFGPLFGGFALGALAGPGLSKFYITYVIVGVLGVIAFLLALRLPIGQASPRPASTAPPDGAKVGRWQQFLQGTREVIGNRAILIASGVEAAMLLGVGALLGFLPLYAKNIVGLSDASLGILLWLPLVMAMAGKPLAGRLSDRIGRKPMILVGLTLCIAMLPLMPLTTHMVGLLVEGAIFGLGMAIVTPSTMALVTDLCKVGHYGAALGVFGTIWDIGEALGPLLAGRLIDASGGLEVGTAYLIAFSSVAMVLVAAGVIFSLTVQEPKVTAEKAF
ncbi:MAG TPA: MFS transporter [Alphaproteobacteria bacterium]|nr:MFS transporter [Alphaproteobacteria bacterium]